MRYLHIERNIMYKPGRLANNCFSGVFRQRKTAVFATLCLYGVQFTFQLARTVYSRYEAISFN